MEPTLIKGGKISRGMLGVAIQDLTKDLADQFGLSDTKGALVSQVTDDSPAAKAGIKSGDVIVAFNGKAIVDSTSLRNAVAANAPGTKATIELLRDSKKQSVDVTLGTLPNESLASAAGNNGEQTDQLAKLGLSVQSLTPDIASQLGVHDHKGLVITEVQPGTPAARAHLQTGDIILQANRKPVSSTDDLRSAMSDSKKSVLLLVKRKGATVFVALPLK
jgi:serine protease Do